MAFDQVVGACRAQSGQQERQRIDPVLEDVGRAVAVVDRRRDVASSPRPYPERVGERRPHPLPFSQPHQRRRRKAEVARPEHVEMARTGSEGPPVPARLDAGTDHRRGIAGVAGVAGAVAAHPDAECVEIDGDHRRGEPRRERHSAALARPPGHDADVARAAALDRPPIVGLFGQVVQRRLEPSLLGAVGCDPQLASDEPSSSSRDSNRRGSIGMRVSVGFRPRAVSSSMHREGQAAGCAPRHGPAARTGPRPMRAPAPSAPPRTGACSPLRARRGTVRSARCRSRRAR